MNKEFEQERVNKLNMKDAEARGEARGRAEGRAEGEAKGRAEGIAEGLFEGIKSVMANLKVTAEQAMAVLNIPEHEQPRYRAMLS